MSSIKASWKDEGHFASVIAVLDIMNSDSQYEDSVSIMVLENIKNRLLHAFRTTAEPRTSVGTAHLIGKSFQVNEELRRAKIDGAITWLRSELVCFVHYTHTLKLNVFKEWCGAISETIFCFSQTFLK